METAEEHERDTLVGATMEEDIKKDFRAKIVHAMAALSEESLSILWMATRSLVKDENQASI